VDFDAVADELYAVAPDEFTARRNVLAKEAADSGEADLAGQIRALAKPKLAAWVVNTLARSHRSEIDALVKLGAALRDATEQMHGEELTALAKQQRQVVGALLKLAVGDAEDAGQKISTSVARSVEQTLRASLADPDAGEELAAGRLVEPLDYVGFPGGLSVSASGATRRAAAKSAKSAKDRPADDARQIAIAEARDVLAAAKAERESAAAARTEADAKVELIGGHLEEVRRRMKELSDQLRAAERVQRAATKSHEQASVAVDAAEQNLADVRAAK
jgi:hypothetical protein